MSPLVKEFIENNIEDLDDTVKLLTEASKYLPVSECNELGQILIDAGIDIEEAAHTVIKDLVLSDMETDSMRGMTTLNYYLKWMPTFGLESFEVKRLVKDTIDDSGKFSVITNQGQYVIV